MDERTIREAVRDRYGAIARAFGAEVGADSCCGPSCCDETTSEGGLGRALGYSDAELATAPEGSNLGLGCGNPTAFAELKPGEIVLDLGAGAGFDCFLAAERVGPEGHVIGVDMTPDMVERARENARRSDLDNVEFRLGEIEALPVGDGTVDVIISNCVLNLSTSRGRAFREAYRVLKPGGRMLISDLLSSLPAPAVLSESLEALVGCLPAHRETYLEQVRTAGFENVRVVEERGYPAELLRDSPLGRELLSDASLAPELLRFGASVRSVLLAAEKPL